MRSSLPLLPCVMMGLLFTTSSAAQAKKKYIPPPLRVFVPFEAAWDNWSPTLETRQLDLAVEDRIKGRLLTEYKEYSSGPLTEAHIEKVGDRPKLLDGDWIRVEFQYEISMILIEERETLVSANANIRALKRQFLGEEEWVEIASNGKLEEEILTAFGKQLFGEGFSLEMPKKGYWDRNPEYIQDADIFPRVVGPERRP